MSWGLCGRGLWARRRSVAEMTVDLDSTVCEVCGKAKHGAAYGHTKVSGLSPAGGGALTTPARCCTLGCGRDRLSAATSRFAA